MVPVYMINFYLIKSNLDVGAALIQLESLNLWDWLNLRKIFPGSGHTHVSDVIMRFAPLQRAQTFQTVMNGLDTVDLIPWFALNRIRDLIATSLDGVVDPRAPLGRVIVTRLGPGGQINLHTDEGSYARAHDRYHIVLDSDERSCEFYCGDEVVHMLTGELWKFNHELPHAVSNKSTRNRINLIVDVRR